MLGKVLVGGALVGGAYGVHKLHDSPHVEKATAEVKRVSKKPSVQKATKLAYVHTGMVYGNAVAGRMPGMSGAEGKYYGGRMALENYNKRRSRHGGISNTSDQHWNAHS